MMMNPVNGPPGVVSCKQKIMQWYDKKCIL